MEALADLLIDAVGSEVRELALDVLRDLGPAAPEAHLQSYVDELLRCTALQSANSDPARPRFHWSLYPGARAGLDNPDTRYRFTPLSAERSYRITGRRNSSTDVSFQLFDSWQGDGAIGEQLAFLPADDLVIDEDGRFTITLDAEPAGDRPCHVQLPPTSAQLTVRDTLADWRLVPMELAIDVVGTDGARTTADPVPTPDPVPVDELVELTRRRMLEQTAFWPPIVDAFRLLAPNSVGSPNPTPGGLANQYSAPGRFDVGDDDALVIRLGTGDARYVGIQLGSLQFISIEPWARQSSINPSQAVASPDGLVTFVISRRDPGVANWLDPGDHEAGIIFMRWQAMGGELPPEHHPTAEVVAFDRLDEVLDGETRVGTTERTRQLELRRSTAVPPRR